MDDYDHINSDELEKIQSERRKPTVVVTGFGPFGKHLVNSSWVAVKHLEDSGGLGENADLIIKEIPVVYDTVLKIIPELWRQYKPTVMVHVGVSSIASNILLEQCAHNKGYTIPDVLGKVPENYCCLDSHCENMVLSNFDMTETFEKMIKADLEVIPLVSNDCGRYLCEFIYYTSLSVCSDTAFIHVPRLNDPYDAEQLSSFIKSAILCFLDAIDRRSDA